MRSIISRRFRPDLTRGKSAFLWGPRKAGKTYWIRHHLKDVVLIDLLKTDVLADYAARPALLRERYSDCGKLIVIDEVQKLPQLLDEVHWMIEAKSSQRVHDGDLKSLRALLQEHRPRKTLVVCTEPTARRIDKDIEILPWENFLSRLWDGKLL